MYVQYEPLNLCDADLVSHFMNRLGILLQTVCVFCRYQVRLKTQAKNN